MTSEPIALRHRIKGTLRLLALAVGMIFSERESQKFVHIVNLGIEARRKEKEASAINPFE